MGQTSNIAFLFPGQGSQILGMGKDLAMAYPMVRQIFEQADDLLGYSLSSTMWEGPEDELNQTNHTQPALFVHSFAALRLLQELYPSIQPAVLAGHSLGEFSAITAADCLDFTDSLKIVHTRGALMKQAGEKNPGKMVALLGVEMEFAQEICTLASQSGSGVQVANDNCPGQIVISGSIEAVDRAMHLAQMRGCRKMRLLPVSIASHSSLMADAQLEFNAFIASYQLREPKVPIVGNTNAQTMSTASQIIADIQKQLISPVRWTESIRHILQNGVTQFIEIGSGTVLKNLVKRIDAQVNCLSLGTLEDFENLPKFIAV